MAAQGISSDSIIEIGQLTSADLQLAGGKAVALANLHKNGFRVPEGICVTTSAYCEYLKETGLAERIRFLLGRKEFAEMRWEELWDLAFRMSQA